MVAFCLLLMFVLLYSVSVSCWLLIVILSLLYPFPYGDDVLCWLLSCPLSYVSFLCFFFSERVPGLIWSGSVYLVTTAGFEADQLIM